MRIAALLYALSWVAVRGMLVCGCPASKGGILRAISPAGRRFRASALVSGRKNHDVYTFLCIHVHLFLVFAFRDARFLSGLSHRFSYIVVVKSRCIYPTCAPFSYLRFRHLGFVVGTVRQVFLHSGVGWVHGGVTTPPCRHQPKADQPTVAWQCNATMR